ncbi:MAG: DUF349 domain-containing protein [Prevotellaceae bacterium]|jgi:hypothetical protein|nr:DUF349 domain-containing protein [Prevotellaceae bacterium]
MDKLEHKENTVSQVETDVIISAENIAENTVSTSLSEVEQPKKVVKKRTAKKSAAEVAETVIVPEKEEKTTEKDDKSDEIVKKKPRKTAKKTEVVQEKPEENSEISEEKPEITIEEKLEKPEKEEKEETKKKNYNALSREELVEEMRELLLEPAFENIRTAAETIKIAFYKRQKSETEQVEESEESVAEKAIDAVEAKFKELFTKYKELKLSVNAKIEEQKIKNLEKKLAILAKLEELTSSADDLSITIPAFRKLQSEWKKVEQVPQNMVTEIWKQYSRYQEKFYDLIKINNDLREYDFKKNYELKIVLCEVAEKLEEEQDAILAFQQLQKLHEEWREIGPVARENREDIWNRFKEASSKINKKHQSYFESLKEKEYENFKLKSEICEKIESIDFENLKTFKQWDSKSEEVIKMQSQWKNIGSASRKATPKISKRFRVACDDFFKAKAAFMKETKDVLAQNLEKRKLLLAKAEELKNSTEWKATGEKLIELQREWKNTGAVSRKYADMVWKKFYAACDYFFEQREANTNDRRNEEAENLKLKNEIIEKIKAFTLTGNRNEDIAAIKDFIAQYNKIGFVPFKEKHKLQDAFTLVTDSKFNEIYGKKSRETKSREAKNREMKNRETKGRFLEKRGYSLQYIDLKRQLRTYENNIEFLTTSSKKGNQLLGMMQKKVADLKAKITEMEAKFK